VKEEMPTDHERELPVRHRIANTDAAAEEHIRQQMAALPVSSTPPGDDSSFLLEMPHSVDIDDWLEKGRRK
jgi:hypothetical protein